MNEKIDQHRTVQDNKVVTLDYTLKVDGGVIDTSEGGEPIQFIQGQGQIISGLEKNLYGMQVGESKDVVVPPEEGYGEVDDSAFADVPRSEFPTNIPIEPGVALQLRDQKGEVLEAYIVEVYPDSVRLNFNHPLAGKELHFSVNVVNIRDATREEIVHGHVHEQNEDEDEEDFEDFEDELEDEDEESLEEEEWEDEEEFEYDEDEEDWEDEDDQYS